MQKNVRSNAQEILTAFAADEGRSAYAVAETQVGLWSGGIYEDTPRPAASLLKLVVAMALEPLIQRLEQQRVSDLLTATDISTVLRSFDPDRLLSPAEMLRLMLSASDGPCTRWAVSATGIDRIRKTLAEIDVGQTEIVIDEHGMPMGITTARNAIQLIRAVTDNQFFPIGAFSLQHSIRNSRIPLGATSPDVEIAHKTGTLTGVAHDVARIQCANGTLWIAFLSNNQHDTLVTSYEMGCCTRALLVALGLEARTTVSADVDN